MGKVLAISAVLLLVAGCHHSAEVPQPVCFPKRPAPKPLTGAEQKALNDTKSRTSASCHAANTQCGFDVTISPRGEIVVGVTFAIVQGNPLQCFFGPGRERIDVYSSSGDYMRNISIL